MISTLSSSFNWIFLLKSQFSTVGDTSHDIHTYTKTDAFTLHWLFVEILCYHRIARLFCHSQRAKCCARFSLLFCSSMKEKYRYSILSWVNAMNSQPKLPYELFCPKFFLKIAWTLQTELIKLLDYRSIWFFLWFIKSQVNFWENFPFHNDESTA